MTQSTQNRPRVHSERGPRKQTIEMLRQFARVYCAAPIGGYILN